MQINPAKFHNRVWSFIKLTRGLFLLGGFLLYALGAAAAAWNGVVINWSLYWFGQVVVTSTQLMAQYLNEYYDLEVDRLTADNRTWFSGGSGILSAGVISPSTVLTAAHICAVVAIVTGLLASILTPWMIPIVILSFLGSWFYSSPPISLVSSGWGELATSVVVALLVPLAGYCMQGGFPPVQLWLVCASLVIVHAAMLISFEIPDRDADLSVGKNTLAVRLGLTDVARVVNVLICSSFLFLFVLTLFSKYTGRWMGLAFPLAIWQMVMVHRVSLIPTRRNYHLLTLGSIGLFSLMVLLAILGFIYMNPFHFIGL